MSVLIGGLLALCFGAAGAVVGTRVPVWRRLRRARRAVDQLESELIGLERDRQAVDAQLEAAGADYRGVAEQARLEAVDLEDLREAGVRNVRFGALEEAGIRSLGQVLARSPEALIALPGVGEGSVERLLPVARAMRDQLRGRASPPPDPHAPLGEEARLLLMGAHAALAAQKDGAAVAAREALEPMEARVDGLRRGARLGFRLLDRETRAALIAQAEALEREALETAKTAAFEELRALRERIAAPPTDLPEDYRRRHAAYVAVLEPHLAPGPGPSAIEAGGMPAEVARAVEAQPLDLRLLNATLRRYQRFGTAFMVRQRDTLLGDEMGLGKTMQALAAMAHLAADEEARHFMAVAPASVISNWARETARHTQLRPVPIRGPERHEAFADWLEAGGLALISFAGARAGDYAEGLGEVSPALVVVDEAHYIKNPEASRSQAVDALLERAGRTCLMSGTPLENRLDEFRVLLEKVSPEAAATSEGVMGDHVVDPQRFHHAIATAYLRRNQEDVLTELPERLEHEEWVELTQCDRRAYREALAGRNYMAMRRAVTAGEVGLPSAKLERLQELCRAYEATGEKVLVFTFFIDVLDAIEATLPVFGRLAGSVPAPKRAEIVEAFNEAEGHAVLIGQITAAGVGLNLQAASVVVLMEPQWKPSTEHQAIARAHRMGQTRRVHVHRLLAEDTVDERITELLSEKLEVFEAYARPSLLKEASPQATEASFGKLVMEVERARLGVRRSR